MKTKRGWLHIAGGIIIALIILFLAPLPFARFMWANHIQRHRMAWDVERRIVNIHKEDVEFMLGEPCWRAFDGFAYRLHSQNSQRYWRTLIIIFDESGMVRSIWRGNPIHFFGG